MRHGQLTKEMPMRVLWGFSVAAAFLFIGNPVLYCQNPELAKDYADEGVSNEAKIEFIKVLHDPTKRSSYDVAEYYLGYLDFKAQNYELASKHWKTLLTRYPNSPYSQKAKEQTQFAYELLAKQQTLASQDLDNVALFEAANFLIDRPLSVQIDTSYLPKEDMAIEWLEKVANKYPKTPAAARAIFREALLYYGWGKEGIGAYSKSEGYGFSYELFYSKRPSRASDYLGKIKQIFDRLQRDYPDSRYAVPVAFLIGQAYCRVLVAASANI